MTSSSTTSGAGSSSGQAHRRDAAHAVLAGTREAEPAPARGRLLTPRRQGRAAGHVGRGRTSGCPSRSGRKIKGIEDQCSEYVKPFENLGENISSDADEWMAWYNDPDARDGRRCPATSRTLTPSTDAHAARAPARPHHLRAAQVHRARDDGQRRTSSRRSTCGDVQETSASTPMFFVLFPGVDPTPWVEDLGRVVGRVAGERARSSTSRWARARRSRPRTSSSSSPSRAAGSCSRTSTSCRRGCRRSTASSRCVQEARTRTSAASSRPSRRRSRTSRTCPSRCCSRASRWRTRRPPTSSRTCARVGALLAGAARRLRQARRVQGLPLLALLVPLARCSAASASGSRAGAASTASTTGDLVICSDVLDSYLNDANAAAVPWHGPALHLRRDHVRRAHHGLLGPADEQHVPPGLFTRSCCSGRSSAGLPRGQDPDDAGSTTTTSPTSRPTAAERRPPQFGLHPNAEIGYLDNERRHLFSTISSCARARGRRRRRRRRRRPAW